MLDQLTKDPILGLIAIMALITAFTIHEFGHALCAKLLGDDTAERAGRLTLNPLSHFDVFGFIALIFISFGWGKPVPVNTNNFKRKKLGDNLVSLAGVFFNFVLAFLAAILIKFIFNNWSVNLVKDNDHSFVKLSFIFLRDLFYFNLNLVVFNLLPIPPLDGSKILENNLKGEAYFSYKRFEQWAPLLLLLLVFTQLIGKIIFPIVNLLASFIWNILGV